MSEATRFNGWKPGSPVNPQVSASNQSEVDFDAGASQTVVSIRYVYGDDDVQASNDLMNLTNGAKQRGPGTWPVGVAGEISSLYVVAMGSATNTGGNVIAHDESTRTNVETAMTRFDPPTSANKGTVTLTDTWNTGREAQGSVEFDDV